MFYTLPYGQPEHLLINGRKWTYDSRAGTGDLVYYRLDNEGNRYHLLVPREER